jgi:DNA replication protein DnaC
MNGTPKFFQTYGTLSIDAPSYIDRPVDDEILTAIEEDELCLVFAPRQTGKSSLIVRTAYRLKSKGIATCYIDMQPFGEQDKSEIWFGTVVDLIKRSFNLNTDSIAWWKNHKSIDPVQRFSNFLEDVVLSEIRGNVVLFFDEVDAVLSTPFSDDFFTIIRSIYNAHATNSSLKRINFVLAGSIRIDKIIKNKQRTPFNVGRLIEIGDFERDGLNSYKEALGGNSQEIIERIFFWTNGQPLLVQRLAKAYTSIQKKNPNAYEIDSEVEKTYLNNKKLFEKDIHFGYIQGKIFDDSTIIRRILLLYRDILKGKDVQYNDKDLIQSQLKLSGIVRVVDEKLVIHNRIYQNVFDVEWIEEKLSNELNIRFLEFRPSIVEFFLKYGKYIVIPTIAILAFIAILLIVSTFKSIDDATPFIQLLGIIIGFLGLIFGIYQYSRRSKDQREELKAKLEVQKDKEAFFTKSSEDIYRAALQHELGSLNILGSPDIESKSMKLDDVFVSLRISESWRSEERFTSHQEIEKIELDRHLTPEEVMKRAFAKHRLLLIIGDPGSGKTTLLKYYAIKCLDKYNRRYRELGFAKEILPIYFPLRELEFNENNTPVSLPKSLAKWSQKRLLDVPPEQFINWLQSHNTLVLLDGLDEISSKEKRRMVCRWITNMCTGLGKSFFVVTSRATGYRKLDGIELALPHLRADIMDFSLHQQLDFLKKWFRAVFLSELPSEHMPEQEWKTKQIERADQRSKKIIEFLKREENKAVQQLAAAPMLLHIMAIIWKDHQHLPKTRSALYDAALNYLLDYRDRQRDIQPVLSAEEARRVLAPIALWMQEELQSDEAPKEEMHRMIQPILNTFEGQIKAINFCENLRDRAGLIADCDRNHYIFRHKSFRDFLSGIQLVKTSGQRKRLKILIEHFKEFWWEEPLRFFMSISDDEIFDQFMYLFFQSPVSKELDAHQQSFLQDLVREAPQKKN